jgi:asparagine synthase (glutamine-hydrolysing)
VKGTKRRFIQLELAKKYLPERIIKRKKQGFNSPLPYMLADEFKLLFKIFLNESFLVSDGYLKKPAIDKLLIEHLGKKFDHGNRLWLLCNAEVWYRMYIKGQGRQTIKEVIEKGNYR